MNVLYCSTTVSKEKFENLFLSSQKKPHVVGNKFHNLFLDGFDKKNNNITSLSSLLMNKNINKTFFWKKEEEEFNKIKYIYLSFINRSVLRQATIFLSSFVNTKKWIKKNEKSCIICDSLNIFVSMGAIMASKKYKIPIVSIVTDLPEFLNSTDNFINKLYNRLFNIIINKSDGYVFLTEAMNKKLNVNGKANLIIEGLVDIKMQDKSIIVDKNKYKNIVYAGGLYREYGVETLIKAFMKIEDEDLRLDLFGDGSLVEDILKYSSYDERIKYHGVVSNEKVIEFEMKSTLLINPRPSNEEFTKYSFPSKNMEYMVSGTPLLTTKLPGMPIEYYDYVYIIEDESEQGMKSALVNIFQISSAELKKKGRDAKEFVLKEKNNIVQSKKILDMVGFLYENK